ncbi:unnamed protein product [Arabis nemorensis]|uniref:RING-type E3 ubiquitin transferase n=1 Tax=Arabis nemorensis TaxID=586526 RepID=A0A565CA32_9BRAS|nr:unnamed protein product [Arabis nemorensis]
MDSAIATEQRSRYVEDDEAEEEDICRICRNPGDANNPLRYPCACNGSIKFVHQDCLFQWLHHSDTLHCEVCKHPFSFFTVYADNAPTRLPLQEFVSGIAMKSCSLLHFFMRLSFVLSVWLLTVPFVTFWIWRLAFLRSFGEAQSLFLSHISTTVILVDCFLGFLLSASIVFIFRVPNPLRDLFRHLQEGIPFDELVGMHGPLFHLVENAFTVLASNVMFLGVVIFVPFTLGRVILYHVSWLFAAARRSALTTASMPFTDTELSLENITLKNALTSISNLTDEGQENGLLGQFTEMMKVYGSELTGANNALSVAADILKGSAAGSSKLYDVTTLTFGQFLAAMRLGSRVAFFVIFMLGVWPLMCGWLLDFSTVRMFGKTMYHRVQFLSVSPLASSLVHWVVGIMYMLQISMFVSLLRGVLRPGVLYFLRDPADPNYNPFRDLIDDPVHKHARRFLLSVAVYGSSIVMLVFLPVRLVIGMAPSVFPLQSF